MHFLHEIIGAPNFVLDKQSKQQATLTFGPLPEGLGLTIGNAMRRILLSSLPGTAVTAFKADGVSHEYETIPGVIESVLDITLNIRQLRLKKHSKDSEEISFNLVKKGEIRAKDLKVSSDIEILDPDQIIATCDGADPKKVVHLRVEKGVSYRVISNEDHADEMDPNYILVDANFSPVEKVSYVVNPARVGDNTTLDQLVLDVTTDGSLESDNAIKLAANILESYFNLFNKDEAYRDEDFTSDFDAILAKENEIRDNQNFPEEESFTPIDILGFSQRTLNALVNGGITSVEQLLRTPISQLSQLRGFGQKAKQELETIFEERGYTYAPEQNGGL